MVKNGFLSTHLALLFLVGVLLILSLGLRWQWDRRQAQVATSPGILVDGFCLGVDHPGTRPFLVNGETRASAFQKAVEQAGLQATCGKIVVSTRLNSGDQIRFGGPEPHCEIEGISRLHAAQRLLCGQGIDVNRDSADELTLLPRIGESRAAAIVRDREINGLYREAAQLSRISGIGLKTVEQLLPWLAEDAFTTRQADRSPDGPR